MEKMIQLIEQKSITMYQKEARELSAFERFDVLGHVVADEIGPRWYETKKINKEQRTRQMFYFSAEFLLGRQMKHFIQNLEMEDEVEAAAHALGWNIEEVYQTEPDPSLGNGGLGRLAACFMDSLATLDLPGNGMGVRYKFGLFKQKIEGNEQQEYPDNWLERPYPFEVARYDEAVTISLGGYLEGLVVRDAVEFKAVPYDLPSVGYATRTVNTLRLWDAELMDGERIVDFHKFAEGKYLESLQERDTIEVITMVLYPEDSHNEGKKLRLTQQFFFVSAGLQDLLRKHVANGLPINEFHKYIQVQMNDTHPTVAVAELMRLLMDVYGLGWDEAFHITRNTLAYTNHTILVEALEKWYVGIFAELLPRQFQIIEELDRRLLIEYGETIRDRQLSGIDLEKVRILQGDMINMANMAIYGGHTVNGVAELHTKILRDREFAAFEALRPGIIQNKTNGIDHRRWLFESNRELTLLLSKLMGSNEWKKDITKLKELEYCVSNDQIIEVFSKIKYNNKVRFAEYAKQEFHVDLDPTSLFDVQIKRLHAYKRQLLSAIHIMDRYNRLLENPELDLPAQTFIFGSKAAPGYRLAKEIIKLLNTLAEKINNDSRIHGKIKIVFCENYRVSVAEKMIPAADLSEQISTASKEASGTGNMKLMMNGALTIGTLDGANVEIFEEAGLENNFKFGMSSEEIMRFEKEGGYNPWDYITNDARLQRIIEQLQNGFLSEDPNAFRLILEDITGRDEYFVMGDFAAYVDAQDKAAETFKDQKKWMRMAFINTISSGKFTSDRTIQQYADELWHIQKMR